MGLRASLEGDQLSAYVTDFLGVEAAHFDQVPALDEILPDFRTWMSEVADRRRKLQES